ncbi:MAG: glycosyltransferase [Planctomycetota bacterium]
MRRGWARRSRAYCADFGDWEIVLADDQSDDATIERAQEYVGACEGRLQYPRTWREVRAASQLHAGLRACRGEFVSQLDGDDFS